MKKLVLIDGMSVLHRAYHAYPLSLTSPKGELTNAVYGFTTILLTVLEKLKPTHVAVAWDVGKATFRTEQYSEYKATREKPDEELLSQIDKTKEVVEALNIPQFGVAGYEADDLIGTLSLQGEKEKEAQVVIVTGDRDALQLVNKDKVVVWMPSSAGSFGRARPDRGPMEYDETAVKAKYGLSPEQIIDLKALMGDSSDNIPGVRGVGPKTATNLLLKYETLEKLYENIEKERSEVVKNSSERIVGLLEQEKDKAFMSKKLATIERQVPIELSWEKCKLSDYDREAVTKVFEELAFKSLVNKLPKDRWEEDLEGIFS